MSKIVLSLKIILLPFTCIGVIYFIKNFIHFQYILSFGILITLFNINKTKYFFTLSFFYSIVLSYLVLFLSIQIGRLFYHIIDESFLNTLPKYILKRAHVLPKSIVSPLLMFFAYRLLFKIEKTDFFKLVKWSSIFILIALGIADLLYRREYLFMSWQFIMALALQLILYQKEVKDLFKKKSPTKL